MNWHNAGENNLARPFKDLIHAQMSMIACGLPQAGGSIDFKQATPEFMNVLAKLFAFRKRFEDYFAVYQHVLGFPDGTHIDGSGHIIGDSGFIVLINPTGAPQAVKIPLNEPEMELIPGTHYEITDWTNLEQGIPIGEAFLDHPTTIDLAPMDVRYIGVNIVG